VPGYTFRIFVTNRNEETLELWRDYNKRATIEQRIEELKAELNADGFCMKDFATEAPFLSVLFPFNLLSLYQKAIHPTAPYIHKELNLPGTLHRTLQLLSVHPFEKMTLHELLTENDFKYLEQLDSNKLLL